MQVLLTGLNRLLSAVDSRDFQVSGKWFLLSALVGLSVGLASILFDHLTLLVGTIVLKGYVGFQAGAASGEYNPHEAYLPVSEYFSPWLLIAVMGVGGAISGWLVQTFSAEAAGPGTGAAVHSFHHRRGYMRGNIAWVKTLASAITIGTGGSAGREGPIAQIGAAIGASISQRLKLTARDRRILLAAGMGAGVGAIFRAPLAGALFAAEILYRDADFEAEVIMPAAMSSIISYGVYSLSLPVEFRYTPMFGEELRFFLFSPFELVPYTIMAFTLVIVGIIYISVFHGIREWFERLPIALWQRVCLGATLAAVFAVIVFYGVSENRNSLAILGTGYGILQAALTGEVHIGIPILLIIVFGKILTCSLTVGSGGSGGVFGPSIVIGGCTGLAVGEFLQPLFPTGLIHQVPAFGVVGMAGFFAGCANAPISTIIMVSELTGEYRLLIPTMWVSTLCFLLMRHWDLYRQQVPTRLESPAHRGDFIVDVLEGIKVDEVYRKNAQPVMIPRGMPLERIVHLVAETQQHYFPVVSDKGRLVGIFSADDVRAYLYNEAIWTLANAEDVMTANPVVVTPDDNLNTALRYFTSTNLDELPVVSSTDKGRLIGMVGRKETIACYNRRLVKLKQTYADDDSVMLTP